MRIIWNGLRIWLAIYFKGEARWASLVDFTRQMAPEAEKATGIPFRDVEVGTNCGVDEGLYYRSKEYVATDFFRSPPPPPTYPQFPAICASNIIPIDEKKEKSKFNAPYFLFSHWPLFPPNEPDYPTSLLRVRIVFHYQRPANISSDYLAYLMKTMVRFLAQEPCKITYGYAWTMIGPKEQPYTDSLRKRPIPDDKLMGVRWANVLTRKQMGKYPDKLIADINRCIAPQQVEEVVPGVYFFRLPFDLPSLRLENEAELNAQMQRVLEAIRPHKVLYMNGRRRHYHWEKPYGHAYYH